jgi:hypothetical protein
MVKNKSVGLIEIGLKFVHVIGCNALATTRNCRENSMFDGVYDYISFCITPPVVGDPVPSTLSSSSKLMLVH